MRSQNPKPSTTSNAVELDFKFKNESPVYLDVWLENGKVTSFGKSAVISWEIYKQEASTDWEMRVRIKMAVAYAKRRGFVTG